MSRDMLTETSWAHAVGLIGKSDIGGNEGSDDEVHMNQTLLAASAASYHLFKSLALRRCLAYHLLPTDLTLGVLLIRSAKPTSSSSAPLLTSLDSLENHR